MNKFVKRTFLYLSIPFVLTILVFFIFNLVVKNKLSDYRFDENISCLYIGDSHIACTVNDSLLDSAKNVSKYSESYCYSYYKLKLFLPNNPNINKVVLGMSYHNLSNNYDDFIDGKAFKFLYPDFSYLLPFTLQLKMIAARLSDLPSYFKLMLKNGTDQLSMNQNYSFEGGYLNKFSKMSAAIPNMDKEIEYQYFYNNKLRQFSKSNLNYLDSIIILCKQQNVDLILFSTPIHSYYKSKIPQKYSTKFNDLISTKKLRLLDFSELPLNDTCFTPEGHHLTAFGSLQVTSLLSKSMKKPN